jgi:hypothetical protein
LASLEAGLKDIFDELGVAGDAADSFFKPHPVLEEVLNMTPPANDDFAGYFDELKTTIPVLGRK